MNKIKIKFAKKSDSEELAKLSQLFFEEGSCNGIVADNKEHFENKNIIIALLNNKIIGYCYGEINIETKKRAFSNKDDKFYSLEEIFVIPEYRNLNIGQKLFEFAENYAKEKGCKTIQLNAVSKDYQKLLSFYIEKLNMNFWSAYLFKKI
ncbi:MAG: GNAT family N-acetyltransferase [Clostridiales bacterium]|nr:GNAT family N-acetyltransferase [Clostridiales bacterium]